MFAPLGFLSAHRTGCSGLRALFHLSPSLYRKGQRKSKSKKVKHSERDVVLMGFSPHFAAKSHAISLFCTFSKRNRRPMPCLFDESRWRISAKPPKGQKTSREILQNRPPCAMMVSKVSLCITASFDGKKRGRVGAPACFFPMDRSN